ncbi:helix-turn-helix transcriptional regulator [Rhizobium ruizarguesonis]|jgi:AraC-like DNA-binding protein|uniref:helix-turn-helix transcriptional regulator n=1 Tax=Rhizobium ruizarguesonis TaxID=2081791 RepID=UPI001030658D|nr:AraC family transcriptional regulator [Rhizobium ruizarguesonis]MBY5851562.1 AraC family transcriptional regulator [Rhizobium leguminosarum]MBY5887412.1 AraC family transcriptional regulator [Rhizobium leguminosarum]QSY99352.1 AraC family transcriptional regulator [Rhizobium ruizarguesonis]TAT79239.1 AraC family transcriptional regulator [Rhizobium ruizarguesonis]TAT89153.1 AraC family transcriptional regulator [Rhizobium ruizarguesonis]
MRDPEAIYRTPLAAAGGLAVTGSGRQPARRAVTDRKLPSFAVVLVERGQGWLDTAASGRLSLTGPILFWLFPNRVHSYGPDEGGWDERWALFEGSFTRDFVRLRLMTERQPVVALHHVDEMARLFGTLHADLLDDTNLGQASAALMLHRIVISAARQASGAADHRRDRPDMAEIVETLRQRAMQPLDLTAFAAEHGMSPATLRRRFTLKTGLPPKAFQLRARMDHAKQLLATTEEKIETIAAMVGLDDPFYFSRVFHEREGCSPREFRARYTRV